MKSTRFLYGTTFGRCLLWLILKLHLDQVGVWFLHTRLSKPMISKYIRKYGIPANAQDYATFRDFFARSRENTVDPAPEHLISPCDGLLSLFPIDENSLFHIKQSHYRVEDLVQDANLASRFQGGVCMIFRLCPQHYHHYCYIDDGYQGENHFIPGALHSVQPIACETYPVYVQNRRSWCLVETDHFGPVIWTEIGAMIVGGIVNHWENTRIQRGLEKGHFDLCGSTIVLLFQKDQVQLLPELAQALETQPEVPVTYGMHIGRKAG